MNRTKLLNLAGAVLIVLATILHIVCIASPYFTEVDVHGFGNKVADLIKNNPSLLGPHWSKNENISTQLAAFKALQGEINFGMWKLCIAATQLGITVNMCKTWDSETVFDKAGEAETLETAGWIKAAQGMGIMGVLLGVVSISMALVNLLFKSKGDRLRLIHIYIATCSIIAGGLMLIGSLIMADNYKDVFDPMLEKNKVPPPPEVTDLFKEEFHLSWSFALDILAAVLAFLAGLAHLMGGRLARSHTSFV